MTTQQELIETFLDGNNSPSTASNMEIIPIRGGSTAYLVGGYGGTPTRPGAVYAVREPINQLTVYKDFRWNASYSQVNFSNYAVSDQFLKFIRIFRRDYEDEYQITTREGSGYSDRLQPSTRDFDRLNTELHG